MGYEITFAGDRGEIRTWGRADPAVFRQVLHDLLDDERWRPGMVSLVDHRALEVGHLGVEDLRSMGEMFIGSEARIGRSRCAILVGDSLAYGLSRMWEALARQYIGFEVALFHEREAALRWLAEHEG